MNRTRLIGLFLLLIAFTGCITIEENYTFKKNGSGTMEYVVDMSQIGEMLKAFEDMGDGKGKEDKDAGLNQLDMKEQVSALKNVPGIKKVKLNNKDKYVQRVSFAFADLNALNAALNVLMEDSTDTQHTFFQWEGNTLVRRSNGHARDIGLGMGNEDPSDTTDMTELLSSMKYKYRFTFQEPIANTEVAEGMAKESPDPRTVKLDTDFSVIGKDEKVLDLRIELKR
ncbi:MAG: hypothetical protein E6Q44_01990 [Flavobacteriales bacterium]|jgi:hypothetical protein|nr:MAG: hypothetical protein E6Q44_01990 [Flavobacteriales bacterium]